MKILPLLAVAALSLPGCVVHKVSTISSEPPGATVTVNEIFVGRTPVEYTFRDDPQPTLGGGDHYHVHVALTGFKSDARVFKDNNRFGSIKYVPDEIHFVLRPEE